MTSGPDFIDYPALYRDTYDAVADEYEGRTKELRSVTVEVMSHFLPAITTGKEILDVGCGVGLAINLLAARGFVGTGIDLSPRMLQYARARTPGAIFLEGDFLTTEWSQKYDGVLMLAFIHLFPKKIAETVLKKVYDLLKPRGIFYVGTTKSLISQEGWEAKTDYAKAKCRFRKHWTEIELAEVLRRVGFEKLALYKIPDPFGKTWMDFLLRKN